MRSIAALLALSFAAPGAAQTYSLEIVSKGAVPAISVNKSVGSGYSPCIFTVSYGVTGNGCGMRRGIVLRLVQFNPAWFPVSEGLNQSILFVRERFGPRAGAKMGTVPRCRPRPAGASRCPAEYGGSEDHILFAYCNADGSCGDVQPLQFPFPPSAEDPRVVYVPGRGYLLYIYASGSGQSTVRGRGGRGLGWGEGAATASLFRLLLLQVYLYETKTPLVPESWTAVGGALPWHRNGCLLQSNGTNYVIFGEAPPLPGLGIATTTDFVSYTTLNATLIEPLGPNNTAEVRAARQVWDGGLVRTAA